MGEGTVSRRQIVAGVTGAVGLFALAACGDKKKAAGRDSNGGGNGGGNGTKDAAAAPVGSLKVNPADATADVKPAEPVTVTADNATIDSVTLTNPDGKQVNGKLADDKKSWRSAEPLAFAKTYTLAAAATGTDGKRVEQTVKFTTVKQSNFTAPIFKLTNGGTYGVGQPVVVHWDEKIPDRAAAEKALTVTTSPQVDGRWNWISDQELHWRGKDLWKPGTTITVNAKAYGVHMGKGLYGEKDASVSIKIGPSRVAVVNNDTHMMEVFFDGSKVKTIPVSLGRGGVRVINGESMHFWTLSGTSVVLEKRPEIKSSSGPGVPKGDSDYYKDIPLKWCVVLTYSGEYIHVADWNIPKHGRENSSHGCINVAPEPAKWIYDNFNQGDVVKVLNTPRTQPLADGYGDWNVSWDEWVKGSAL